MTTERLIEHRTATLDIYRRLVEARAKTGKTIPVSVATSQRNLDQNRFLLAIVGKIKAGKSTFINALLKEEILPTDALQATAAIIEIGHATRPFLRVTYANGSTEEISPNEGDRDLLPLKTKLREVAAIRSEDRDLPIAQLNDFIIERYNPDSKQAEWDPDILDLFLQSDLPNIHKKPEVEIRNRSRVYLEQHRDGKAVAKRVEVGFPSAYQLDHFRIVDTPGICAKGGFAKRTLDFLINADGVIYLHKDEPSEETLHNALQNVIPEKAKKHILLVLTHKCQRSKQANDAYLSEAQKCCPQITSDRIFIVDSLTEIVLQALHGKSMDHIRELCATNDEWKQCISTAVWDAKGNAAEFFDLMEQQSNMRSLRQKTLQISGKALSIQIETVLGAIEELYAELEADASDRRDIYGGVLKDPQQFSADITREMETMEELKADCAKRIAAIQREFNLDNPNHDFGNTLRTTIETGRAEINGKHFTSGDTAKTADDYLNKINQDVDDYLAALLDRMKVAFQHRISEMELSMQNSFDITVPKIPLTDLLAKLRAETTQTVTRTVKREDFWGRLIHYVTFGRGGKRTEEIPWFDATKYFEAAKQTFVTELLAKKQELAESVKASIEKACAEYKQSLDRKLNLRRQLIVDVQERKEKNDAIQKSFDEESSQVEAAKSGIADCVKIRRDL